MSKSLLHDILLLVKANGNQIENRIVIQKIAYILKTIFNLRFESAHYSYHHFGPYSRELSGALQETVAYGLLKELAYSYGENQIKYIYEITELGNKFLDEQDEKSEKELDTFSDLLNKSKSLHWRTLELSATVIYLEKEEKIPNRDLAFERAIQLKPECLNYLESSKKLLDDISPTLN